MCCRCPFWQTRRRTEEFCLSSAVSRRCSNLASNSTLRLVGVGAIDDDASILSTGLVERHEFEEARALGAVGELLGHLFSMNGDLIDSGVSARALSMSAADIKRRPTVAVAGGSAKIHAINGVLASGLLHGLITDESTARALVN